MANGKTKAKTLINDLKAGAATKEELRADLIEALNIIASKLNALDSQLIQAKQDFAETKKAEYDTYIASLPNDVGEIP